jgi:hypothetical protein
MPENMETGVASALPDDIRESLAVENVKAIGGGTAFLSNLAYANAVANQQALNQIAQAAVGKIVESIIAVSPAEGGADVATLGQLMKGLSLTPPPNQP